MQILSLPCLQNFAWRQQPVHYWQPPNNLLQPNLRWQQFSLKNKTPQQAIQYTHIKIVTLNPYSGVFIPHVKKIKSEGIELILRTRHLLISSRKFLILIQSAVRLPCSKYSPLHPTLSHIFNPVHQKRALRNNDKYIYIYIYICMYVFRQKNNILLSSLLATSFAH